MLQESTVGQTWFTMAERFDGWGRVEFGGEHPALEGPAVIEFNEQGHVLVELEIQRDETGKAVDTNTSLWDELSAAKTVVTPSGQRIRSITPDTVPCTLLTVVTSDGTLEAQGKMRYGIDVQPPRLRLRPARAVFNTNNTNPAKYWVLPLLNFVAKSNWKYREHDAHVLRLYPGSSTGTNGPTIIGFQYMGGFAFVEPLADYEERAARLESDRTIITAVMVAEVSGQSIDTLETWLPFNVLRLLGFATGVEVGAPWIEFRDESGTLVRRVHWLLGTSGYQEGRAAIEERVMYADEDGGTGYLLTQALASPMLATKEMRFALGAIRQGGLWDNTLETGLSHLFRALECLCKYHGLNIQNLREGLDNVQEQAVRAVVRQAEADIRTIARRIPQANPPTPQELEMMRNLEQMASRMQNADTKQEKSLGLAAAKLLKLPTIGLHDADLIDTHFLTTPHPDGSTWSALVSRYRNIIVHDGYLEFTAPEDEADRLRTFMEHLLDVLVRVVLRMLNYDGTYQPQMMVRPGKLPINWVQPGMDVHRLRY